MTENEIGTIVVEAAIAVHRALGPGLLESVYEVVLAHELNRRGVAVDRRRPISIEYDAIRFDQGFRADIRKIIAHRRREKTELMLAIPLRLCVSARDPSYAP